ncbi:MAG: hypothetical protein RL308_3266 [Bacteroidota bacterium]|jgi:phage terminase large subunit
MKLLATEKQKEAHKLLQENTIVIYGGAIRGAKSYWGCMEIITLAFTYKNSRWLMVRESWSNITSKLFVTFQENFITKGLDAYIKDFNRSSMVITFHNGSQIIFMAESFNTDKELNRFRGLEINGAFVDELNEIQEQTFDKIIERSGSWFHSKDCPIKILASTNPTQGWVKKRFYEPFKNGTLKKDVAYIQARIYDNPFLPKNYLDGLKLLPTYQYMVFVEGNWDVQLKTGGEFYKSFELDKHVINNTYNPDLPLHLSFDENVNPYFPCLVIQITGKKVMVIDEIALENPRNTVEEICKEIKSRYQGHKNLIYIYGDATSNKRDVKLSHGMNLFRLIQQNLKMFKTELRVLTSNPSVQMRGSFINQVLFNNFNQIKIEISEKCTHTINDFILLKESEDGTKSKEMQTDQNTKVRSQKYGHLSDAFDYLFISAFLKDYTLYQKGGNTFSIKAQKVTRKSDNNNL